MDTIRQINFTAVTTQVTGRGHLRQAGVCEDVLYSEITDNFCYYGVADGQSGKSFCRLGGREALIATASCLREKGISALSQYPFPDEIQYDLVRRIRGRIGALSESLHVKTTEFSSTLLALAFDKTSGLYILLHLGDGCAVGVRQDRSIHFLSVPENGITSRYTWLTTSDSARSHLRSYFGQMSSYRRIILLTDGADCICQGKNIRESAMHIITGRSPDDICTCIKESRPSDDASSIIIDITDSETLKST